MDPEQTVIAGLDQDWAECADVYDHLTPSERGELAEWILGKRGDLKDAPPLIVEQVKALASVAFMETALRWRKRTES